MIDLVLHPVTTRDIERIQHQRPHAVLLTGPVGSGKKALTELLCLHFLSADRLSPAHPIHDVGDRKASAITIDDVRTAQHHLSLKSSGDRMRIVTIIDAGRMGREAQNALLKTLEEPPAGVTIVLTASSRQQLLPTILSRVQHIDVQRPDMSALEDYFKAKGFENAAIRRSLSMSGGLPGLMHSLLTGKEEHPLNKSAEDARAILRHDVFGKLTLVDTLVKQRESFESTLFMLEQMAVISLQDITKSMSSLQSWRRVLEASYEAQKALRSGAQPKLVATKLMLSL